MSSLPQNDSLVSSVSWPTPDVFPDESPELPDSAFFDPGEEDSAWWAENAPSGGEPDPDPDLDPSDPFTWWLDNACPEPDEPELTPSGSWSLPGTPTGGID